MSSESNPARITAVVLSYNGERLLDKCLESLSFCESVLVVDSGSSDNTLKIAEACKATVVYNKWEGFPQQLTFAMGHIKTPWFFILDQDEICPPELARALQEAAANTEGKVAYEVPRSSWYFDRFMKHSGWSPDYMPRLGQVGKMNFVPEAHVRYETLGPSGKISAPGAHIVHYPYTGFNNQLDKLNSYADIGAGFLRSRGKKGSMLSAIAHSWWRFMKMYFLRLGFLDGRAGFIVATHDAFYTFVKYIRVFDSEWGKPFDYENHRSKKS